MLPYLQRAYWNCSCISCFCSFTYFDIKISKKAEYHECAFYDSSLLFLAPQRPTLTRKRILKLFNSFVFLQSCIFWRYRKKLVMMNPHFTIVSRCSLYVNVSILPQLEKEFWYYSCASGFYSFAYFEEIVESSTS